MNHAIHDNEDTMSDWGNSRNPIIKLSGIGKAYMLMNLEGQIIGCNQAFLKLLHLSKKELLATRLARHRLNNRFLENLNKAVTEGLSIYKGNLDIGDTPKNVFLETLLLKTEYADTKEKRIVSIVLGCSLNDQEIEPAEAEAGMIQETNGALKPSVSLHKYDGNIVYITPSIQDLLGYTSEEFKEMEPFEIIYPDDIPIVQSTFRKLNDGSDIQNSRYRMVHKNGSIINVESSSFLMSGPGITERHILNITSDLAQYSTIKTALERSELKYQQLSMNLPTGIALISVHGQLLEVNEAMKYIMEIPEDVRIQDMNFFEIELMNRYGIDEQLNKCIATKEIISGSVTYKISNKNRGKHLLYSFVPVLKRNHEVDSVIGYVTDYTKQMKAEIESRERAEFLNLVINAIKSPFFVKDEAHKWVMLNDAAVEMMGQSRETLVGKSDYDLYPKEQADIFWKNDELVLKAGSSTNKEQITWSDGSLHTIVTYKQLYTEKSTGRKFIVGTIHDISEYKKIEEELRASEIKYHELFDNANDFIITIDLEGRITNANRKLLIFLQMDIDELTQRTIFDFIPKNELDLAYGYRDKVLAGTQDEAFEINALNTEGKPVTYEVKASQIIIDGILSGVQCVFGDVTARKETRLKLENYNKDLLELNKTKDQFFSIIAHDLRNPYNSMIGFTEMLLEDLDKLPKEEIRESLKIIHTAAKNSYNLLDNLLAWSRLETGHMLFDPGPIHLTECVEEVINILFSSAYRKQIEINNMVSPDTLIYADRNMLNTILNNLIMNAIKYTPTGGEIHVFSTIEHPTTAAGMPFVKISVKDTGIGMDAETLAMVFNSSKMTSQPGTEKEQGSGLGLMLTREMAEKHGGKIGAESTPGKGSVFTFYLPVHKSDHI